MSRRAFLAASGGVAAAAAVGMAAPDALAASAPALNLSQWRLVFADSFTHDVARGSWPPPGWHTYAYGSPDTAMQRGLAVGGIQDPRTTWVSGGQLHVRMFRPAKGGPVHCGTSLPLAADGVLHGRSSSTPGCPTPRSATRARTCCGVAPAGSAKTTGRRTTGPATTPRRTPSCTMTASRDGCTSWRSTPARRGRSGHPYEIRWQPGFIGAYLDGRLIGGTTRAGIVPVQRAGWRLQNESSLVGAFAKPGSWAQMDTSRVGQP